MTTHTRYAVDVAGLSAFTNHPIMFMLAPVIKNRTIVRVDKSLAAGGAGVLLDCAPERAKAIIEVVRKKIAKHELAFYRSKTGNSWERI